MPVRAELKTLDRQVLQLISILESIAVGIVDELAGLGEHSLLTTRAVAHSGLEPVDQLDGMSPEDTHLAGHVVAETGEVPILGPDQVRPVPRRDVGIAAVSAMIADAVQDGCR